ncbi:hypothetical protein CEXT_7811 [Caerostris extrusa]|uniref:Uncharacterized protein n=1 Tax=Caerostris extrusa TaxID=172846 RepID=A0AAV4Y089_CAEEX|nr:hypothetical protein CEXT_7811 [Caerostris extrusa]
MEETATVLVTSEGCCPKETEHPVVQSSTVAVQTTSNDLVVENGHHADQYEIASNLENVRMEVDVSSQESVMDISSQESQTGVIDTKPDYQDSGNHSLSDNIQTVRRSPVPRKEPLPRKVQEKEEQAVPKQGEELALSKWEEELEMREEAIRKQEEVLALSTWEKELEMREEAICLREEDLRFREEAICRREEELRRREEAISSREIKIRKRITYADYSSSAKKRKCKNNAK